VITLVEDWVQGDVPLSKPPLVTTWEGVQAAAAAGAVPGEAAAGVPGSETAARATTVRTRAARALRGVGLTRNSFEAAGIPACSVAGRDDWGAPLAGRGRVRVRAVAW
jgi:hypothetical protein